MPAPAEPQPRRHRVAARLAAARLRRRTRPTERERQLIEALREAPASRARLLVLSAQGRAGTTTTTLMLAETLAAHARRWIAALDLRPGPSSLGALVDASIRGQQVGGPIRVYPAAAQERPGPRPDARFVRRRWAVTLEALEPDNDLTLIDAGTTAPSAHVEPLLGLVDRLVVVSEPSADAEARTAATLDWLECAGHRRLVADSIVVVNQPSDTVARATPCSGALADRCAGLTGVGHDRHLGAGAPRGLAGVSAATRGDFLELAAALCSAGPPAR